MGFPKGPVWRAPRIVSQIFPTNASVLTTPNVTLFVADADYTIEQVAEVHEVLATDGSAVTLDIVKCTGTQTAAQGTSILTAAFNLKATINTVVRKAQSAGLVVTNNKAGLRVKAGDRIAAKFTGTLTALTGVNITLVLHPYKAKGLN